MILRAAVVAASSLSLLLCAATVALWVRTHYVVNEYITRKEGTELQTKQCIERTDQVRSVPGKINIEHCLARYPGRVFGFNAGIHWMRGTPPVASPMKGNAIGYHYNSYHDGVAQGRFEVEGWRLSFSIWSVTVIFALGGMPIIIPLMQRTIGRGPRPGCCRICGYDLRATPDGCPECGTTTEKATQIS